MVAVGEMPAGMRAKGRIWDLPPRTDINCGKRRLLCGTVVVVVVVRCIDRTSVVIPVVYFSNQAAQWFG